MREGDTALATDKEPWEHFATLYKLSNRGIRGRGKDSHPNKTFECGQTKGKTEDEACPGEGNPA